jgi:hypothetical protein
MDAARRQAFHSEIANLIHSAEFWHAELETTIARGPGDNPIDFEWQVQERLKVLLVSTCGLARIFDPHPRRRDPSYSARKQRGDDLRREFQVTLGSAIFPTEVRDSLEHLDERIDDWIDSHPGIGLKIWRIYSAGQPLQLLGDALREFDIPSRTLRIGKDEVTIQSLIAAVREIKQRIPQTHRLDVRIECPSGGPPKMNLQTRQIPGTGDKPP